MQFVLEPEIINLPIICKSSSILHLKSVFQKLSLSIGLMGENICFTIRRYIKIMFTSFQLTAPCYQVFPLDQAMTVFDLLNQSQINGRAILEVTSDLAPLTDPFPSTAELTSC